MPARVEIAEADWAKSASKADLKLLEADLGARIDSAAAGLEVKIAEGHQSLARIIWLAVATLGAVGILLRIF